MIFITNSFIRPQWVSPSAMEEGLNSSPFHVSDFLPTMAGSCYISPIFHQELLTQSFWPQTKTPPSSSSHPAVEEYFLSWTLRVTSMMHDVRAWLLRIVLRTQWIPPCMMIKPDLCFYNLALRTLTVDVKESSFVFQAYPPILASHWSGMTRLVYLFSLSNK